MNAWRKETTEACLEKAKVSPENNECWPGRCGSRDGCIQGRVEQNAHHRFGGQSRKVGGLSGALGSP
jgi:hypothetical protein